MFCFWFAASVARAGERAISPNEPVRLFNGKDLAGYTVEPGSREVNSANMEGFLKFARAAAQGGKRMIISHSQQRPDGYASTTETADYLITQLGGEREIMAESWPSGLKLLSRFRKGGLEIYGLAGDTAADHMKHLQNLSGFLVRNCE